MNNPRLKNCPFCDIQPRYVEYQVKSPISYDIVTWHKIMCDGCGVEMSSKDPDFVIDCWNQRSWPLKLITIFSIILVINFLVRLIVER